MKISLTPWHKGDTTVMLTKNNFDTHNTEYYLGHSLWNCSQVNPTEPHYWEVNVGSGNGLVPSGNKPLQEPMLI